MKYLPATPRDWWQAIGRIGRFYRSAQIPAPLKFAPLALSAVYFLLPVDFVPDFIPLVGQLDDVSVVFLIHMLVAGWAHQKYWIDAEKTLDTAAR
ncbi:YkvA family protein [Gloeobacter morelensis]|uniref:DUF1232 domain-containing protein n=1 Tax=Gloeobacter morelensis MG652769 TaxID=2781736 RepID=A0ABY3PIG3_9CYAN|nr:YkvA family protein [Gloeobacter morelensis]UFP93409.1 DUF1232 domain-containing protein [Gloeobacter morelensis MG652769]